MRICHISINHKPDDDRIYYKEVLSLAKRYDDIWVVIPEAASVPKDSPVSFRFYSMYKHDIGRLSHISTLARLTLELKPDLIHCHEPESLRAAMKVKRKTGCAVIYDSHELYPAAYAERFRPALRGGAERIIGWLERREFRGLDGAIGATWGITRVLKDRLDTPHVATLLNVPVPEVFASGPVIDPGDRIVFCHEGFLSFDRGLKEMMEAVRRVAARHAIQFRIVGDVFGGEREWLDAFVAEHRLEEVVQRTGWLPYEKVGAALQGCHAGLICFRPTNNNMIASPNKLFNYLLYGIPILAPSYINAVERIVLEEECGLLFPRLDPESIAATMEALIEDPERRRTLSAHATRASETKYTWKVMEERLFDLYDKVLAKESGPATPRIHVDGDTDPSRIPLTVCLLTSGHRPDDDRIYFKEGRSLAKRYRDVVITTAFPTKVPAEESHIRFLPFERKEGDLHRFDTIRALVTLGVELNPDIIICHEPESLVAAVRIKAKTGCTVIFDSHEMYSASIAERLPSAFWDVTEFLARSVEKRYIARCDGAIGASWAISEYLASIIGATRVTTLLNVPAAEVFGEQTRAEWGQETIFCHDGHLGFDRGLKVMAEAIRIVSRSYPARLKIVGDVFGEERAWLEAFVAEHHLESVITRTGWLPYREVGRNIAECHVGLICFQKSPNTIVTSSNKVFNYLFCGLPFVGPDYRLSTKQLVLEERCGVLADTSDPKKYAEAMIYLIEHREETRAMAERALQASRARYRWHHMEKALLEFLDLIHPRP